MLWKDTRVKFNYNKINRKITVEIQADFNTLYRINNRVRYWRREKDKHIVFSKNNTVFYVFTADYISDITEIVAILNN